MFFLHIIKVSNDSNALIGWGTYQNKKLGS